MEAKLALYQLGAPCATCGGLGARKVTPVATIPTKNAGVKLTTYTPTTYTPKVDTTPRYYTGSSAQQGTKLDRILGGFNKIVDATGGVVDIYNKLKNPNQPIYVQNPQTGERAEMSQADKEELIALRERLERQGGTAQEKQDDFNERLQKIIEAKNAGKDNKTLYIGLAVGGVVLITMMMMMMNKK